MGARLAAFGAQRRAPSRSRPVGERVHAVISSGADRTEVASLLGGEQDLPRRGCGGRQAQALCPRHVPVPQWGRAPCRASRRLHGHGYHLPLQADAWVQRAPSHGLGRVRTTCRAICGADEHTPADDHADEHRHLPPPDQVAGVLVRLGPGDRHHRPELLPVDPVDLSAALRYLVRPRPRLERRTRPPAPGQGTPHRRAAHTRRYPGPRGVSRRQAACLPRLGSG